jgi:tetratricopeptide (TPR) repeat protein
MRQSAVVAVAIAAASLLPPPAPTFGQDVPEFSPEALAAYAAGAKHYQAARYREAIPQYTMAYELDRTFVVALFQAALCHSNLGNISTRDSLFAIVEASKDRLSNYYRYRLETQLASAAADPDGALEAAHRAAAVGPGTKGVYQVAFWALRRNRPAEARDALLSLDPFREPMKGWTAYWSHLTWAHHLLGEHDAELAAARRAREMYPELFFARTMVAQALAASGQMEELERVIEESKSATPGGAGATPGALMTTAAAELAAHGNAGAAEDLYNRSAVWYDEQPPDRVASVAQRNWRTLTLIGAERWEDAKPLCGSLLEDAPENSWFHTMDGYLAARLGDRERALSQLQWLEEQGDALAYESTLHAALGDKARALELLAENFEGGAYFNLWWHRDVLLFPLLGDDPAYQEIVGPKG